jgi:putative ABC transport system permease protein
MTVVGVVADATFGTIGETGEARAYVPLRQEHRGEQTLVVHTRGDPNAMLPTLASIVRELDPALPVYGRTTMARNVSGGFSLSRTAASIAGFFGVMALLISTVGLYAVVASGVTERTREIGVRVALGSSPRDVMRVVMRGGARLGLVGLALGLIGAVVMARAMGSLLYGLSPVDPLTFGAVPVVLAIVVVLATYVPARRAVRLDPMAALRSD